MLRETCLRFFVIEASVLLCEEWRLSKNGVEAEEILPRVSVAETTWPMLI